VEKEMTAPAFFKKKILVVDDDDTIVDYMVQFLEAQGFLTFTASNGKAAADLVKTQETDLLLIDVEMPVMNGFEAIKTIRSDAKTRLIPIILITALKKTEDRIKGIEAGCDDFISKPFDTHELLARIRSLLIRSYSRRLLDEKEKFEYVLNHMDTGIIVKIITG
jgi:putative two-component system response regulator